jgi:hypothetical protein
VRPAHGRADPEEVMRTISPTSPSRLGASSPSVLTWDRVTGIFTRVDGPEAFTTWRDDPRVTKRSPQPAGVRRGLTDTAARTIRACPNHCARDCARDHATATYDHGR